jgi:hypothetical protein
MPKETSKLSVSQSLLKKYWDYKDGLECGIALHEIDILKNYKKEPSKAMLIGTYMEYICTGAINRDGSVPEPIKTKSGISAESERAKVQAERFKRLMEVEGFGITEVSRVLEYEYPDQNFKVKGVLDVLGTYEGKVSILDIKSSGLIGNEWEDYGWHTSTFNMRRKLTIQVVFYKYLAWKVLGIIDIPFFFAIHSSKNDVVSEFWEVKLLDFDVSMSHFEDMLLEVVPEIEMNMSFGFTPYPDVKRCSECPLVKVCSHKRDTPEKKVVVIDGIY